MDRDDGFASGVIVEHVDAELGERKVVDEEDVLVSYKALITAIVALADINICVDVCRDCEHKFGILSDSIQFYNLIVKR